MPEADLDFQTAKHRLAELVVDLDEVLAAWLPGDDDMAPGLAAAMRYSVLAGGKRLRPALVLAACDAVGGRREDALPFALAVELVHTYSLIHDDLPAMDDDDLRRGRPTSHKVHGEALAILAGDALHTLAFEWILARCRPAERAVRLARLLAEAAGFAGMVGGQVLDLAAEGRAPTAEQVLSIHARKTGALLRAAVLGGAISADADEETVAAIGVYGRHLGLAFQIVDDILDETGSAAELGKTPGKDRREAKLTLVAAMGLDAARERAEAECAAARAALPDTPGMASLHQLALFATRRDR